MFNSADLTGADLTGAILTGTDFSFAFMPNGQKRGMD